jgi:peptidoglycan/xylan/chitin deacetylase (PgdA/CDA1 family)
LIRLCLSALALVAATALSSIPASAEETCPNAQTALGVSRIVEIDAKAGPLFGGFTKYEKEPRFLGPKEVVLTFDDGPMPKYTKPILDALDKFCTKATFFYVGQMAQAYPDMVKEVMGRGHTMGTHTWSHPLNLRAMSLERSTDQIERGFAAVALAAGQPIAPFFRFPGLSDSAPMLAHLQERGIAAFTVDVVSNDSYIGSPSRLVARTLDQVERQNGGIVLFHDIKASTAHALPTILTELKKRG